MTYIIVESFNKLNRFHNNLNYNFTVVLSAISNIDVK